MWKFNKAVCKNQPWGESLTCEVQGGVEGVIKTWIESANLKILSKATSYINQISISNESVQILIEIQLFFFALKNICLESYGIWIDVQK